MRRSLLPASWLAILTLGLGLALPGCNSATGSGPGSPPPPATSGVTVQGTVLDVYGNPIPHADVLVGKSLTATSTDGTFSVSGVSTPYTLALYLNDPYSINVQRPIAIVYEGLTLTSPTLQVPVDQHSTAAAALQGSIGTAALASSETGVVIAGGSRMAWAPNQVNGNPSAWQDPGMMLLDSSNTAGGSFGPLTVDWGGALTRASTVFALTLDMGSGTPGTFRYLGFAAVPATLDGTASNAVDLGTLSMSSLTSPSLSATVAAPSSFTLGSGSGGTSTCASMSSALNVGCTILVRFTAGNAGAAIGMGPDVMSANVPRDSGGAIDYAVAARAEPSNAADDQTYSMVVASVSPGSSNGLTLPTPPAPQTPSTTVTTGTTFSWGSLANSVYAVDLNPTTSSDADLVIITAGTQLTLPDLSALGFQMPAGHAYDYRVSAIGPFHSVDAAVSDPQLVVDEVVEGSIFPFYQAQTSSSQPPFVVTAPVRDGWFTQSAATPLTAQ